LGVQNHEAPHYAPLSILNNKTKTNKKKQTVRTWKNVYTSSRSHTATGSWTRWRLLDGEQPCVKFILNLNEERGYPSRQR